MTDLEKRKKNIETGVKITVALGVGFVAAPFIFIAIKGLLGLIVAAGVGITAIQFAPYFAAKIANWRLKAIKAEASANPILTLQNDYQSRMNALASFRDSIRNFAAEVNQFEQKLELFSKNYPDEVPKFEGQLAQMNQLLELRKNKYEEAKANLAQYDLEIKKSSALYDMALAAAAMSKAAGVDNEEFLAKIQRETALDSVQKSLNVAFADLEIALLDEKDAQKVSPQPQQSFVTDHSSPIPVRQKISV